MRVPLLLLLTLGLGLPAPAAEPVKVLFLGDRGHHQPAERFRQLQPVLAARGFDLTYTDKVEALNPQTLQGYAALMLYANIDTITPDQAKALLDFVAGGKGFVPLHCASYCFRNNDEVVALIGAQFQRHGTGTFRTEIAAPDHPVMKGFRGFQSWDETYVHTKHNPENRTVLEYRAEGTGREPWTWVRTHGKGRVFYTAWGHDARTWGHPGFQNLVERGLRWAIGGDPAAAGPYADRPEMTAKRTDVVPFEYVPANVPFYPPSQQWGRTADPLKQMQKPLPAAESVKHYVYPTDLEPQLFVSEPDLGGKPIAMNWDERGRLWVAVTIDYPNNKQPEGQGHDKILICEDTDGDGKADKFTVFADKLSIPTSLTFARGGVIVHQAPETLFLKDTDGDDKADVRQVLFTGWSTSDTHAGPSNLRYGLDNWLYGIVGYAGYRGTIGGEEHRFAQGFYRFKPDGSKMEFLRNTNNNSWGVGFSEEGLLFGSTANGNPSVYLPIPNRYYEKVRGWSSTVLGGIAGDPRFDAITDKIRQVDHHGRFTAAAGHALYTARTYPSNYWNRTAFVAEPTGHLVATFELKPQGTDFTSAIGWNLLASDDEWAAPTMAEVGPDGNVWVIDWYNYIVQHNPTPPGWRTGKGGAYETELRDKKYGRIYRLVAKGAKPAEKLTLKDATPEKLVATLRNDNMFWRVHAQRLLVERGNKDVVPALVELLEDRSVDTVGLNAGAIHALWTLHGLGAIDGNVMLKVVACLGHPSPGVRRNAVLVLPRTAEGSAALVSRGPLTDADAQVRLAALLALAEMPEGDLAGQGALAVLNQPATANDHWLTDAVIAAAATHARYFLRATVAQKAPPAGRTPEVLAIVAEHFARGGPADTVGELLAVAAFVGEARRAEALVAGLAKGWPRNTSAKLSESEEQALAQLLAKGGPANQGTVLKLASALGAKGLEKYAGKVVEAMLATVADEKQADDARSAAVRQLVALRPADAGIVDKTLEALTPRSSPTLAAGLLDALAASEAANVGPTVVKLLPTWPPSARGPALRLLLARNDSTRALIEGLEQGKLQLSDLALDQKQALASHRDQDIAARAKKLLERGGGLPSADRQKVIDQFLHVTKKTGNADKGKLIFKNTCAKCHLHGGEGAQIGPDLTGMAVHPKEHLIVEILDPSRSVEGNYRVYTVATTDGRTLTGLLASETKTSVELLDSEAKKHTLLRENIEELKASNKSLMPEGFEKQLSETDLTDLLEFLTRRGQYLPLPLAKAATVVTTRGMFYSETSEQERLVFADWGPKTFKGIPFQLIDPLGGRQPNAILLYGPQGAIPPRMPKAVKVPCNAPAKAIHFLSGVSGWGFPYGPKGSVSLIVRLHYADGTTEDHALKNGDQFADYIRRVDVPGSEFAFDLAGRQIRYLKVVPERGEVIKEIELVKGPDQTAPVVMAVTVEPK